jgi:hypothetical protein
LLDRFDGLRTTPAAGLSYDGSAAWLSTVERLEDPVMKCFISLRAERFVSLGVVWLWGSDGGPWWTTGEGELPEAVCGKLSAELDAVPNGGWVCSGAITCENRAD